LHRLGKLNRFARFYTGGSRCGISLGEAQIKTFSCNEPAKSPEIFLGFCVLRSDFFKYF
jgi:hypothetical protein